MSFSLECRLLELPPSESLLGLVGEAKRVGVQSAHRLLKLLPGIDTSLPL